MNKCKIDKYDVALGKILKEYRVQNNLTLQNIADKLGVTRQMIFYYENGRTPLSVTQVIKICDIYGIDYATVLKQAQIEEAKL
jgi:transcriptional regulator with XRE-family HTH domain